MPHCIAHAFEPLLQLLWPTPGRHRRPDPSSASFVAEVSTACPARVPATRGVRGEEVGPVRLCLVAHERRKEQRQQARRRMLRLTARGIDVGPRLFDGVEATA